ncbi:MAG: hypothetical protein ACRDDJ_09880 [[Mycobacterium] stephanolepidis]
MSNIDDANQQPEPPADPNTAVGETMPTVGVTPPPQTPEQSKRGLLTRSLTIAGAVAAVMAVLTLTFGAGVWAGSEFGDEYGREGHSHRDSHSYERDSAESDHADDARRGRDRDDDDDDRARSGSDRDDRPSITSPVAPTSAPPTSGRQ